MFLVNSRPPRFLRLKSAHIAKWSRNRAPLIANLRGHFAEFLNQSSLKRLGLLDPPTCVGLRYGMHMLNLEAFLGSMELTASVSLMTRHHVSGS